MFVGHELTEESACLLRDGVMAVAIDQAPELQARRSIDVMLGRLRGGGPADQQRDCLHAAHGRELLTA